MKQPYHPRLVPIVLAAFMLACALTLLVLPAQHAQAQEGTEPTPTPSPAPLTFPLPTPNPIPVSAWRPPLYQVPWALGEHDHFFFVRPIAADDVNWPLSAYRYGDTNFDPTKPHTGVDIVVDVGTPVLAAGDGQVVWSGYGLFLGGYDETDPYGLAIAIKHDFGYYDQPIFTVYAHNSKLFVTKGQIVKAGQIIALSGDTGLTTAPHLHFEVRMGINHFYNSYNPILWTAPPQGWGVLVGRLTTTWGTLLAGQEIRVTNYATNERWYAKTYGTERVINTDPYYNENLIIPDLPAGRYELYVPYVGRYFRTAIDIHPGGVTYFNFNGFKGINTTPPPITLPANLPGAQP